MGRAFDGTEIAVIGMAGRYPKSRNLDEFWSHLREGHELISFFTEEELRAQGVDAALLSDPHFVKAAVPLEDMELFDAAFFGFMRREAELLDPQHRLFLETAWEALENAGYNADTFDGLIAVYAGAGINTYFLSNILMNPTFEPLDQLSILLASDKDYMMTRASYKLNLRGPSIMVQSACSTSLVAIHLACQSLLNEECDMALAGASTVQVIQRHGYYSFEGGVYSPDGHCRPFDAHGQGTIFGNGVGIVVLKRLADALAAGDHIEALIKGSAINNDGSLKVSYTAPSVEGQAEVIAEALANAGISADTISYIEAHGTATPLGDPIEIKALTKAFTATTDKKGFCAIGSVKSNLGHLDAAAGVTGIIKTVLSLKHKLLAPSLHFTEPNPAIDFPNTPFYVNSKLADWIAPAPRRAGVSSFGIGGTNVHIILEEAPPAAPAQPAPPEQLLVLSAKTATALDTATDNLVEHLRRTSELNLADVAFTLQTGRRSFKHRRILISDAQPNAIAALSTRDAKRVFTSAQESQRRPVVFMFPGQGAQAVNMARTLYEHEPTFRAHADRCAELLRPELKSDLRGILFPTAHTAEAEEQLTQTAIAQPALFVIEYALAQLWQEWGVKPWAMIGHSLGEYVAACLAGVFSLAEALRLVVARGRLMQGMPAGAMLAVPLAEAETRSLLGPALSLAAVNAPTRCVVSGTKEAIAELQASLEQKALICKLLHTSHAFHSAMMEPLLEPFARIVAAVKLDSPQIPYLSNLTGEWITPEQAVEPGYWVKHLRRPVRFADGISTILQEQNAILLEVGPGQTLSALARLSANGEPPPTIIASLGGLQPGATERAALLNALGQLWLTGTEIDWTKLHLHERRQRVALPTYPFERQRYWIESPIAGGIRTTKTDTQGQPESLALAPRPAVAADLALQQADAASREPGPNAPALLSAGQTPDNGGSAPGHEPPAANSALGSILAQQLQVMSRQLKALRGTRANAHDHNRR